MNALEVISRVYALLSECRSVDIGEAAEITGDTQLGAALRELAGVKRVIEEKQRNRPTEQPTQPSQKRDSRNGLESRIRRIVLDPAVLPSNREVAQLLSSLNLGVSFRRKDGRKIMLQRLEAAMETLTPEQRKEVIARLSEVLPKSETAGWFGVIRGESE